MGYYLYSVAAYPNAEVEYGYPVRRPGTLSLRSPFRCSIQGCESHPLASSIRDRQSHMVTDCQTSSFSSELRRRIHTLQAYALLLSLAGCTALLSHVSLSPFRSLALRSIQLKTPLFFSPPTSQMISYSSVDENRPSVTLFTEGGEG